MVILDSNRDSNSLSVAVWISISKHLFSQFFDHGKTSDVPLHFGHPGQDLPLKCVINYLKILILHVEAVFQVFRDILTLELAGRTRFTM